MVELQVRRTEEQDWPAIFEIRRHELVMPQQYRLSARDTPATMHRLLNAPHTPWVSWTVLQENRVIGHVIGLRHRYRRTKACSLGWNLHPEYWGRGLMNDALLQVFDEIFQMGVETLVADRFEQNERCGGLLAKLHFRESTIGRFERLRIWVFTGCAHRIIRMELNADRWWAHVAGNEPVGRIDEG